jgi:hypothetical protein
LPHFAHRFQAALPAKDKLQKTDLQESLSTVISYMARDHKDCEFQIDKAVADLEQKQASWAANQAIVAKLEATARRKAFTLCAMGASIGFAQFGLIAFGTFEYYSWDIMEPICYLMTFSNFTFGYLFYLGMKRELEMTNIYDILTRRFLLKACSRRGIDLVKHEQLQDEIKELAKAIRHANV